MLDAEVGEKMAARYGGGNKNPLLVGDTIGTGALVAKAGPVSDKTGDVVSVAIMGAGAIVLNMACSADAEPAMTGDGRGD